MPSINEPGAFWGLISGLTLGGIRMGLDMAVRKPSCLEKNVFGQLDMRIDYFQKGFPFLIYALFLFVVSITVAWVVSRITQKGVEYKPSRHTYWQDRIKVTYTEDLPEEGHLENVTSTSNECCKKMDLNACPRSSSELERDSQSRVQPAQSLSIHLKCIYFLCGFEPTNFNTSSDKQKFELTNSDANEKVRLNQSDPDNDSGPNQWKPIISRKTSNLVDTCAVICVLIAVFMWWWFDRVYEVKQGPSGVL